MTSMADRILHMKEDDMPIVPMHDKLVMPPLVPNLKQSSKDQIDLISQLFHGI